VTGANRGIGREVARQLAEADYTVLLAARDEDKARAAAGELPGDVRALELDVADPASIAFAAGRVEADPGSLDVLVNNGGVGTDFGVAGTEPDFEAMQQALETNFFGATGSPWRCWPAQPQRASPSGQRVERDGRGRRDGRVLARLPRVEGGAQRHDADSLHGARR